MDMDTDKRVYYQAVLVSYTNNNNWTHFSGIILRLDRDLGLGLGILGHKSNREICLSSRLIIAEILGHDRDCNFVRIGIQILLRVAMRRSAKSIGVSAWESWIVNQILMRPHGHLQLIRQTWLQQINSTYGQLMIR